MHNTLPANGMIGGIIIAILMGIIYLAVKIPYCCSLYKTMKCVPSEKRIFPNGFVWIFLIPVFDFIFEWMMLPFGIPIGLKNAMSNNPTAVSAAKTIKGLGLAMQILSTCGTLLLYCYEIATHGNSPDFATIGLLFLLWVAIFVLWIIQWVDITAFRKKYFEN